MTGEMTGDQKLRRLAEAAMFYRSGVSHMLEAGMSQEDLDLAIDEAEEQLQAERREKKKRLSKRRSVRSF